MVISLGYYCHLVIQLRVVKSSHLEIIFHQKYLEVCRVYSKNLCFMYLLMKCPMLAWNFIYIQFWRLMFFCLPYKNVLENLPKKTFQNHGSLQCIQLLFVQNSLEISMIFITALFVNKLLIIIYMHISY